MVMVVVPFRARRLASLKKLRRCQNGRNRNVDRWREVFCSCLMMERSFILIPQMGLARGAGCGAVAVRRGSSGRLKANIGVARRKTAARKGRRFFYSWSVQGIYPLE
jgi:hypothetical protein